MRYTLDLTWVRSKSYTGFKKMIGGRVHYLGADEPLAIGQACLLVMAEVCPALACRLNPTPAPKAELMGMDITTLSEVERTTLAKVLRAQLAELEGKGEAAGSAGTLYALFDDYLDHERGGKLSPPWLATIIHRTGAVKKLIIDRPVEKLDYASLDAWVQAVGARWPNHNSGKHHRQAITMFLTWAENAGRWHCERWRSALKIRRTVRPTKRIQQMSLDQFSTLFKAASPRMQCFMLLAVNCGHTQMELATLQRESILDGRIDRARNKTGVWGSWQLWSKTAELLAQQLNGKDGLAFQTEDGRPLVHYSPARTDSVAQMWSRLLRKAKTGAGFGFKSLRKLGAQLVKDATHNLETAKLFLSHKGLSVAEMHYVNADNTLLDSALKTVEAQVMAAIGMPVEANSSNVALAA